MLLLHPRLVDGKAFQNTILAMTSTASYPPLSWLVLLGSKIILILEL